MKYCGEHSCSYRKSDGSVEKEIMRVYEHGGYFFGVRPSVENWIPTELSTGASYHEWHGRSLPICLNTLVDFIDEKRDVFEAGLKKAFKKYGKLNRNLIKRVKS